MGREPMIRARVQNGRWVLDDPAGLPEGTVVEIVTRPAAATTAAAATDVYLDSALRDYIRALLAAACSPINTVSGRRAGPLDEEEIAEAAKAIARRAGRNYTIPADIKAVAPEILHRFIVVPPDASARGVRAEDVVKRIVNDTPLP